MNRKIEDRLEKAVAEINSLLRTIVPIGFCYVSEDSKPELLLRQDEWHLTILRQNSLKSAAIKGVNFTIVTYRKEAVYNFALFRKDLTKEQLDIVLEKGIPMLPRKSILGTLIENPQNLIPHGK